MTTDAFLRCFRRFTACRSIPSRMISDNSKTFKSAGHLKYKLLESPEVRNCLIWNYNLEKAPWWGGTFDSMICSMKMCLKAIGGARLSYDEVLTVTTQVEGTLNPLTYVTSEDLEEPITPSHLLFGYRLLSLPEHIEDESDPNCSLTSTTVAITQRMKHEACVGALLVTMVERVLKGVERCASLCKATPEGLAMVELAIWC